MGQDPERGQFKKELAERLTEELSKLKMKDIDIAKALDMKPQLLSIYKNGGSIPGGDILRKLTSLGVDVNYLLTGSSQNISVTNRDIKKSSQVIGSGNNINNLAGGNSPQSADEYQKLLIRYNYLWDELLETKQELAKCKEQIQYGSKEKLGNKGEQQ